MREFTWKTLIEGLGIISIVGSLVFVGLEVRQSGRAANDASLSSDNANIIATEELVLTHPDVWYRGCVGDPLEPVEEVIFSHIHHAYVFQYFLRWVKEYKGMEVSSAPLSIDNVAMNIHRYPGFRREWDAHGVARRHVPDEVEYQVFRKLVDQRAAEYEAFEPVPLRDDSRCGLL